MIERTLYLKRAEAFIDTDLIKIFTGIRRCGKTVILRQMADRLRARGVAEKQILLINLESLRFRRMAEDGSLYDFILKKAGEAGGRLYLMLDEVQLIPRWQVLVNSLRVDIDCDLYLTGSNSTLLSGELSTYLSGRYVRIEVYPFTLAEAKAMRAELGRPLSDEALFADYLKYGGFPQRFYLPDGASVETYLRDLYEAVVMRDIITRHSVREPAVLSRVLTYLLDNVGNPFSARKVAGALTAAGFKISAPTVLNEIRWFQEAYVLYGVKRYDVIGKDLLTAGEKYYACDTGLRNVVKTSEKVDVSKLYENVVYLTLRARGWQVEVGKWKDREIDFVCRRGSEKCYIQVAYLITDRDAEREFGNLEAIGDNYPKYVISADLADLSRRGIVHQNILAFLLGEGGGKR